MKTIRDLCNHWELISELIDDLEARERERDEAERERVKAFLVENVVGVKAWCGKANHTIEFGGGDLVKQLYPQPKPETLPDGYYWCKAPWAKVWSGIIIENHVPLPDHQYRPANDPPPEVTGNTEPTLPTFEEWCTSQGDDLSNWNQPIWTWWSDGDNLGRRLPKDLFDAIDGDVENYSVWRAKNLRDNKKARAALKAALLKLKRIRE